MAGWAGNTEIKQGMTWGDLVHYIYGPNATEADYAQLRSTNPALAGVFGDDTSLDQFVGQQATVSGMLPMVYDLAPYWAPGKPIPQNLPGGYDYNSPSKGYVPADIAKTLQQNQQIADQAGNAANRDAFAMLQQVLKSWGLEDLGSVAQGFLSQGLTANEITLKLQQTPQYQQRFAGNQARIDNGLTPLQPADYIALENSYQQILSAYGLPSGFYDSHDDFVDFIGKNISPAELDKRANIAQSQYLNAPEYVKNLWGQYFGSPGDAIAAILDPDTATAVIQNRASQVAIGGAAAKYGFGINQQRAQQFQQAGVTEDQANTAYQQISEAFKPDQMIANRFGTTFDQQAEENSTLLGDAEAINKRKMLYANERGLFKESSGADINSLSVSQAQ